MPKLHPPAGFVSIGPGIYMSPASSGVSLEPNDSAPNLILLFGWMGALTRHLENYTRKYAELYSNATQIIVTSGPSVFFIPDRIKENRLIPVMQVLNNLGFLPSNRKPESARPRVLVHSFSNGGGFQLVSLARLLAARYPSVPPSERLVSALVLDSSPSIGTFRTISRAFSIAIRNPVARCIVLPIILAVYSLALFLQEVFGREMAGTRYYRMLLQPRLFPWMNEQTPRLYIFSRKDDMVLYEDVQRHAEAARVSGLTVRCEVFDESAHVAHMRLDPVRYWGSIQDTWQLACRQIKSIDTA